MPKPAYLELIMIAVPCCYLLMILMLVYVHHYVDRVAKDLYTEILTLRTELYRTLYYELGRLEHKLTGKPTIVVAGNDKNKTTSVKAAATEPKEANKGSEWWTCTEPKEANKGSEWWT
jgi:hypothetical protein